MKKGVYFIFVCSALFFISGCNRVSLKCTRNSESSYDFGSTYEKYNIVFKNDVVYKFDSIMEVTLSENTLSSDPNIIDSLADTTTSSFPNLLDKKGVSYSVSKKKDGFTSKLKINFDKLDGETKKSVTLINYKGSYSENKKSLESVGFECK